jgi:hypothetical protein
VILAAALLVLTGLGLFVGGLLSGVTALYWGCVAVCAVAAVLLVAARRQMPRALAGSVAAAAPPPAEAAPSAAPADRPTDAVGGGAVTDGAAAAGATAASSTSPPSPPPSASSAPSSPPAGAAGAGDPPVEEVEVTDLLLVVDLKDEVLVVDEQPRYHVAGCSHLAGRTPIPLPLDEARTDGFTPCGICGPDATLADRVRARKHSADS